MKKIFALARQNIIFFKKIFKILNLMKNIIIATLDISLMGGVEKSNNNLAKLFGSKGHQVTIISFFRSSETPYFKFEGIDIVYLNNIPIRDGILSKLLTFIAFFKLQIYLQNIKSDYLVLSCFPRISIFLSIFFSAPKKNNSM